MNRYVYVGNNPANWRDPSGLTQYDIDVALRLISETHPEFRIPQNILADLNQDLGEYRFFGDQLRLNENYLCVLSDALAQDLLTTILEEILHANSSIFQQLHDTYNLHPALAARAAQLANELIERYRNERRMRPTH